MVPVIPLACTLLEKETAGSPSKGFSAHPLGISLSKGISL